MELGDPFMTMIACCRFRDGAVIIADARATWRRGNPQAFQDTLQKILPLGRKTALAFAGDVTAAAVIVNQLRLRIKKKPRLGVLRKLAAEIPRIAKHYYGLCQSRTRSRERLALILAGVDTAGNVRIWCYESPFFRSRNLTTEFEVLGTGAVVKTYLQRSWDGLEANSSSLKARADRLLVGLEEELQKQGIETVGGLLQVILIDSAGIRPLRYGFVTLDPEGPPYAKSMQMEAGRWVQRDEARRLEVPLVEPVALIRSGPGELRFHDFQPSAEESRTPKWHMTYFLTSFGVRQDIGKIEFAGIAAAYASPHYPLSVKFLAAIGVWGSAGNHQIEITFVRNGKSETIHRGSIHIKFLPEELDVVIPIALDIPEPGPAFLECHISGQLLGRRALYFGNAPEPPANRAKLFEFGSKLQAGLLDEQRACRDAVIEDSGKAELVYLSACQNCVAEDGLLRLEGQFVAVFSKSYPLQLRLFIASAFRFSIGDHMVRVDLVNAATREVSSLGNTTVTSTSSCIIVPIHGELIGLIPTPGIYFLNAYVDDQLVGSTVLAAETEKPRYSYMPIEEDLARIAAGEPFVLLRRSQQRS